MPLIFHMSSLLHNAEVDDEGLDYLCSRSEVQQDFELNAASIYPGLLVNGIFFFPFGLKFYSRSNHENVIYKE